jgi:hypothetical protein
MSIDSDSTIGVGPLDGGFAVWICTDGAWFPHEFDSYPEARAFAAKRYAQGGFAMIKDFIADPSLLQPESDEERHLRRQVARLMDALASAPSSARLH